MFGNHVIEVCLDSVESAINAQEAGADRVELCDNLFAGGTTPSAGAIRLVREKVSIGVQVIIRPRGGDFCYSDIEFDVMKTDIRIAGELGADGVVIGILKPDGRIDCERCASLIEEARPMNVTFHRAFDVTPNPFEALEEIISLGVDRILTSGQEASVPEGVELIAELVKRADNRIIVMPGAGISERNFTKIAERTNAKEFHIFAHAARECATHFRPDHLFMGGELRLPEYTITQTSVERLIAMKSILLNG